MADPMVVRTCIRAMWVTHKPGTKLGDEEEQIVLATLAPQLVDYTDDAVKLAASEWMATSTWFPKPVEFLALVRRHQEKLIDRKALGAGPAPEVHYPIGREGHEGIAAGIVIRRMMLAAAKVSPKGYLGRWAGLSSDRDADPRSLAEKGHTMTEEGHDPECQRCWDIAAVAYEEAIKFQDSTLTKASWLADSPPGLRRCRNELCEYGWVSEIRKERGVVVERLTKCETCGGPVAPRAKVPATKTAVEGMTTVLRRKRRRL